MATGTNGIATKQDLWNLTGISSSHQVSNPTKCFVFSTDSSDTDLFSSTYGFTFSPGTSSSYSDGQCVKYSDIYFLDKPTITYNTTVVNTSTATLVISFNKVNYTGNHRWINQAISLNPPSSANVVGLSSSGTVVGSAKPMSATVMKSAVTVIFTIQSLSSFLSQCKKLIFTVSGIYYSSGIQYALDLYISQVTVNWPLT